MSLGTVSETTIGRLNARNLTLNSDATPNYKYMLGPHRRTLSHQQNITTYIIKTTVMIHGKEHNRNLELEHKKQQTGKRNGYIIH